jgi:hypothetical protein
MICNALSDIEHRDTSGTTHLQQPGYQIHFPFVQQTPYGDSHLLAPGQLAIRFELEFGGNFCLEVTAS